jgi:hypothetical protein
MPTPVAGLGRLRVTAPLLLASLAACSQSSDTSLLDAYLEPQRPMWAGMAPPAPVPPIARDIQLVGMATGDLRNVFGEPTLVRHEGGVQYWRYSFTGCTLDLFVNTSGEVGAEVVYFDLQPSTVYGNGAAKAECARLGHHLEGFERRTAAPRELPAVESF